MFNFLLLLLCLLTSYAASLACPSVCKCSSTVVTCIQQGLTDQSLLSLTEFPTTTLVLNLSSNRLTSIDYLLQQNVNGLDYLEALDLSSNGITHLPYELLRRFTQLSTLLLKSNQIQTLPRSFNENSNIYLDLAQNPLECVCKLKWIQKWLKTINITKTSNCYKPRQLQGIPLTKLKEQDLCVTSNSYSPRDQHQTLSLSIYPDQSQLVYENDPFYLNCSLRVNNPHGHHLTWTVNNIPVQSTETSFVNNYLSSALIIPSLHVLNHSGLYTCSYLNRTYKSVSLKVLSSNFVCNEYYIETSKGTFKWPRTLNGNEIELKCPYGNAPWFNLSATAHGYHKCSSKGNWIDLDLSQCAFKSNISKQIDDILTEYQQTNSSVISKLVELTKVVSHAQAKIIDIILLISVMEELYNSTQATVVTNQEQVYSDYYRLADFILQVGCSEENQCLLLKNDFIQAIQRLHMILVSILKSINHQPWIFAGKQLTAITLIAQPTNETTASSFYCFVPDRQLLTLICDKNIVPQSRLSSIYIQSISNSTQLLYYRQSTLFINMEDQQLQPINNLGIFYAHTESSNLSIESYRLTFHEKSASPFVYVGKWNKTVSSWTIASSCIVEFQNPEQYIIECTNVEDSLLTLLSDTKSNIRIDYLELAVYVSSIIASCCFLTCIMFYLGCSKVYLMPRRFYVCLINYWLSLSLLFPLFSFGVNRVRIQFLCQVISIALHYFCLTSLLWLTLLTYCIWRKLYVIWSGPREQSDKSVIVLQEYDDDGLPIMKLKSKPLIQFYFIGWGIPLIICGINVAISREQYLAQTFCFLNGVEPLLSLLLPSFVFIFLLVIFLIAARVNISRLTKEALRLRNLPDSDLEQDEQEEQEPLNNNNTITPENLPIIFPAANNTINLNPECNQSHNDSICSSDMDHQHSPHNQLLAILFQLLILILIFITSTAIFIRPLHRYFPHIEQKFKYEYALYSHLYGFLVLLLALFTISFYLLSRADIITYLKPFKRKKNKLELLHQQPPPPAPPQTPQLQPITINNNGNNCNNHFSGDESVVSHNSLPLRPPSPSQTSTTLYQCLVPQNSEITEQSNISFGTKYQAHVASKYYAKHRHQLKQQNTNTTTASESSLLTTKDEKVNDTQSIRSPTPQTTTAYVHHPFVSPKAITIIPNQTNDLSAINYDLLPQRPIYSPTKTTITLNNGALNLQHSPTALVPSTYLRPTFLYPSPLQPQINPSAQAIIRPLPLVRLSSPTISVATTKQLTPTNGSFRLPSSVQRPTETSINYEQKITNNGEINNSKIWKKHPENNHHNGAFDLKQLTPFIDDDDEEEGNEGESVSLKSTHEENNGSTTTSSSETHNYNRRGELSSSSSDTESLTTPTITNGHTHKHYNNHHQILHESSV